MGSNRTMSTPVSRRTRLSDHVRIRAARKARPIKSPAARAGHRPSYLLGSGWVRAAPSRQRYAAVQAEQRLPVGRLVLDDDLDVAHRRTEIDRQGAQRVVNRLFERIIETRPRTRIHPRNGARIGAGIETASSWGPCGVGRGTYRVGGTAAGRRDVEIVLLPPQLHVPAAHGDVVEEDVAAGMSAHRGHRLISRNRDPALGPRSTTISAEPAGSPVGSGSKSGRFDPRVLFPVGQTPRAVVCPVAKPGPDLWRMARDARSFELGPLLAARRVGARRVPC